MRSIHLENARHNVSLNLTCTCKFILVNVLDSLIIALRRFLLIEVSTTDEHLLIFIVWWSLFEMGIWSWDVENFALLLPLVVVIMVISSIL